MMVVVEYYCRVAFCGVALPPRAPPLAAGTLTADPCCGLQHRSNSSVRASASWPTSGWPGLALQNFGGSGAIPSARSCRSSPASLYRARRDRYTWRGKIFGKRHVVGRVWVGGLAGRASGWVLEGGKGAGGGIIFVVVLISCVGDSSNVHE